MSDLRELQEWMSILVQHSKNSAAGARTKAARSLVPLGRVNAGKVVVPNDRMTVFERLDVYNGGYFTRLKEVLEGDFAALVHALGDHAWFDLALGYVARYPSRHANLNVLNRRMPEYIASKKDLPHRAFLRDLADLEVRMTMAFDAPEFTPMNMDTLLDLTPEQWERATFVVNPSLQLLTSNYKINPYLQMVFDGREPPRVHEAPPERMKTFVTIYRKEHKVWRHNLPRPMYLILKALSEGLPLAEAIAAGGDHDEDFQYWFQDWSGDGLFTEIR